MRPRTLVPLTGLLAVLAVPPAQPTWSRSVVAEILTRYATGDYAGAIKAIEGMDHCPSGRRLVPLMAPDNAFIDWQHAAKDWIRLGTWPPGLRRRQLITATVALEVVRARPELHPYRRLSFLGWACELVRDHPVGSEAERLWYLTSIAVMDEKAPFALLPAKSGDMTLRSGTPDTHGTAGAGVGSPRPRDGGLSERGAIPPGRGVGESGADIGDWAFPLSQLDGRERTSAEEPADRSRAGEALRNPSGDAAGDRTRSSGTRERRSGSR